MKTKNRYNFLITVLILTVVLSFTFCKSDDGPAEPVIPVLSPSTVDVAVNGQASVSISSGVEPFSLSNVDVTKASVSLSGRIITVQGIAPGSFTATVSGSDGGKVSLAITVADIKAPVLTPSSLSLVAGAEKTSNISDGVAPYTISGGDPAVATATIAGNIVTVKGVAGGTTSFNVTGTDGGQATLLVEILASALPEFVDIPAGSFAMGADKDEYFQIYVHTVTLNAFKISKTEITNTQYCTFLNAWSAQSGQDIPYSEIDNYWNGETWFNYLPTSTAWFNQQILLDNGVWKAVEGKENYPMILVSWFGAKAYCDFYGYSLPTEAEWEYAARGGSGDNYIYSGSDILNDVAWWEGNSDGYNYPVGQKKANGYGLYDMSGNVWEWCNDWFDQYYYLDSPTTNPTGPATGTERVVRGGAWAYLELLCRLSTRRGMTPDYRSGYWGFRVCIH